MGCTHGPADRAAATSGAAGTGTGHTVAYLAAHLSRLLAPSACGGGALRCPLLVAEAPGLEDVTHGSRRSLCHTRHGPGTTQQGVGQAPGTTPTPAPAPRRRSAFTQGHSSPGVGAPAESAGPGAAVCGAWVARGRLFRRRLWALDFPAMGVRTRAQMAR